VTLGLQCRAEAPQRVLPRVSIESRRAKRQLAEACRHMLPRALVEIQGRSRAKTSGDQLGLTSGRCWVESERSE
jgi:hypothetical protein